MLVAVFGDAHAHAQALDAVIDAAQRHGVQELWSLGDMIGRGPDFDHVVTRTRERCAVALMGNHDYGATGSAEPSRFGAPGSPAVRSIELARDRLSGSEVAWMRTRKPAARRGEVQLWHGGPRNAVHEYVGPSNAAACLAVQRAQLGLVGHTHMDLAPKSSRRTAAGFPRNARWFWKAFAAEWPDVLSPENKVYIAKGLAPAVDPTWILWYPGHAIFEGDWLCHHHVEQGPMAVPVPCKAHETFHPELHELIPH